MLSSTNFFKRSASGLLGPAAGIAAICCVAAPAMAQDECATATVAVIGSNNFDTTAATASANAPADTLCAGTFLNWLAGNKDVWFVFTPSISSFASFNTCFTGGYDTSMALYQGTSCGTSTLVACNGDAADDTGCQAYHSEINDFAVTAGTNYYIRIGGYCAAANDCTSGAGVLTISAVTFAECANSTDGCGVAHATGGCSDTACCEQVCGAAPDCCLIQWDSSCVDLAVALCGLFQYSCTAPAYPNDCATSPQNVTDGQVVSFNTCGANTDGPPETGCNSGNDDAPIWQDLWYRIQAVANGTAVFSNCNTAQFDSKIAAYDLGTSPTVDGSLLPEQFIGCNEDCAADAVFYSSELSVTVQTGHYYLVRLGGFENACGAGTISFNMPDPCSLPSTTATENEPCGDDVNPGCDIDNIVQTTNLALNTKTAGTFWADADTRDTDWYKFTITSPSTATLNVWSASFAGVFIISGDPCGDFSIVAGGAGTCPSVASACLNPGTYYAFVGMEDSAGEPLFSGVPCGSGALNNYVIEVATTPAVCPELLGTACADPGPDNVSSNTDTVNNTNSLVACAGGSGATSYTTDNYYARVFPAGSVSGEIHCISFGVSNIKLTSTTTAVVSDLAFGGRLKLYRDINGGAPVNPVEIAGGDLEEIASRDISIPGGQFVGVVNFDPPLCVSNETANNLVVALEIDPVVPTGAGYQVRARGNNNGPTNITYLKSAGCAINQYTLTTTVGATFTTAWLVSINGDNSGCGAACVGDLDNSGTVDGTDLGLLLGSWGACAGCPADLDDSGTVDGTDLGLLLGSWGACP